ncbi:MAG: ATP synthase F1 subunit delta [Bryobacteraceae bacterium]
MVSVVSARYAKALVDVVMKPGSGVDPDASVAQIKSFAETLAGSSALRNVFLSPAISPAKKRAVVGRLADAIGAARQIKNFLFVLVDHRRMGGFLQIAEAYETLLDEQLGFIRADVTSAQELTAAQRTELEAKLAAMSGKRTRPHYSVDPALIGGVIAKMGSMSYDGSVRGEIQKMRTQLAAAR